MQSPGSRGTAARYDRLRHGHRLAVPEPCPKDRQERQGLYSATLKSVAGTEVEFWTALAFGESEQTALLNLAEGEKCAVQGSMKLEAKAGDGEVKIYKTVFVDALLTLKPAPRERKPRADNCRKQVICPD